MGTRTTRIRRTNADFNLLDADDADFKAALYIPAYHTEGKKNPRHPCHPYLKDYLHAEGEPCSSATLVNYHFPAPRLHLFVSFVQYLIFSFYICAV